MSDSEFPLYLSPSQISSMLTCGEQYRLTRVKRVPERPGWGSVGGSAVHRMTEDQDRARLDPNQVVHDWMYYWNEALDEKKERSPQYLESEYYCGGRASKAWPKKENPDWWHHHGPKFVERWGQWLEACGLEIWEYPSMETGELVPAIELEVYAERPGMQFYVKSIIDRVLVDAEGLLYIVDIKSGSHIPAWPQQLALNNLGFKQHLEACPHALGASYAGFWKAREGGIAGGSWTPLDRYDDEWVWGEVEKAYKMRDQHLFIAQPTNLCKSACGVAKFCKAMGGSEDFFLE